MLRLLGASQKLWNRRVTGLSGKEYVIEFSGTFVPEEDAEEIVSKEYMAYCPMTNGLRLQKNMIFYLDN